MKNLLLSALLFWSAALAASAASAQVAATAPASGSQSATGAATPETMDAKKAERREAHRRIRIVHRHRIK